MNFAFSEEQQMLRATARRFLDDKVPSEVVRRLMETDTGFDPKLWADIAEQGWQAMAIPEAYGGAGFTFMEQAILMEEMGRSLFPAPFLSSIVLGADLILTAGSEGQKLELLPGVASGERRVALAQVEESGTWDSSGISMVAKRDGDAFVLDGIKSFVLDGHTADTLLVVVRTTEGSSGDEGISLLVVDAEHQFDEEFVSLMFSFYAGRKPFVQLRAALSGEAVDALLGSGILLGGFFGYQAALLQPVQGGVDLGRFHVPDIFTAYQGLEGRAQLVAVAWALC